MTKQVQDAYIVAATRTPVGKAPKGMFRNTRLRVGYFAQHQTDELVLSDTPIAHMARAMPKAVPSSVRAQLARFLRNRAQGRQIRAAPLGRSHASATDDIPARL